MAVMSDLPPELLGTIARNLTEPTDLIRFRSVSTCCRGATSSLPMLPPRLPWFFLCFISDELLCYFYSFSKDRIYKVHLPDGWEFKNVDLFDLSSTRWFHASKEKTDDNKFTSLLNLFTGTAVDLPVPQINLNIMKICPDCSCIREIGHWLMAKHYFISVAKSSIYPEYDCIISNLTRGCEVVRGNRTLDLWLLKKEHLYYLAAISDKLYILVNVGCGPLQFVVYVMNRLAKKQEWIYVSDIGNRAILYDQSRCFLVEAGCSTGLERNCVYFPELRPCKTGVDHHVDWFYCISRFHLSNGTSEEVSCQLDNFFISDPRRQSLTTHPWILPYF